MEISWITENTLTELALLALAFVLSAAIGLERHRKLKSAGLRTHTLVGLGSAVFTLVSAYGFHNITEAGAIADPSRIAAQIVSGIGFLGAGVIFVRKATVSGLTTAASIWATAAVGMACGAGEPLLAIIATLLQLLAVTLLGRLGHRIRGEQPHTTLRLRYKPGFGSLRTALILAAERGMPATVLSADTLHRQDKPAQFVALVQLERPRSRVGALLGEISDIPGVKAVDIEDEDEG